MFVVTKMKSAEKCGKGVLYVKTYTKYDLFSRCNIGLFSQFLFD